ncbi:MAG: hypothetical protein FWG28_03230 [Clostridiales bacterium]|nr:hypothetical protein [Clostridiales bacterium]
MKANIVDPMILGNVYIVSEVVPPGFSNPAISGDYGEKGSNYATVTADSSEFPVLTFTNSKVGGLTIRKELAVAYADWGVKNDTEFKAEIMDLDAPGSPALVFVRDTDGSADYYCVGNASSGGPYYYGGAACGAGSLVTSIPFAAANPVTLANMPLGKRYEVKEIDENGLHYTTTYAGNGLPLTDGAAVTVTNTYVHGTGNLTIRKALFGDYKDMGVGESTVFTATIADLHGTPDAGGGPNILRFKKQPEANGSYYCVGNEVDGFSGGYTGEYIIEIPFTAAKPTVLTNLWAGEYQVMESASDPAPAAVTYDEGPTLLPTDGNAVASIANTYTKPAVKPPADGDPATDPPKDDDKDTEDPDPDDPDGEEPPADPDDPDDPRDPDDPDGPRGTANITIYAPPGGSDPYIPPNPTVSGHAIEPGDDGIFIEFDEEGVPLGEWHWEEVIEEWIFEEYPPLGSLPITGAAGLAWSSVLLACLSAAFLLLIVRSKSAYTGKHMA